MVDLYSFQPKSEIVEVKMGIAVNSMRINTQIEPKRSVTIMIYQRNKTEDHPEKGNDQPVNRPCMYLA
jgi:hypothetical protein